MNKVPEEKLNIPGDYQYKALQSKNVWLSNWHGNKMVAVRSLIKNADKKDLLDIGAGSGIFEYLYANNFQSVTVVDHHQKAVRFLSEMAEKNKLSNVDIKKLSINDIYKLGTDNKYDVVLLLDVIEHIDDKTVSNLLKHIRQILNPNGVFIVTTPNYRGIWPIFEFASEILGLVPKMSGIQHVNHFNKRLLLKMFSEHGYKNIFTSNINTYSFLFPNKNVANKLVKFEMKYPISFGNLLLASFKVKAD